MVFFKSMDKKFIIQTILSGISILVAIISIFYANSIKINTETEINIIREEIQNLNVGGVTVTNSSFTDSKRDAVHVKNNTYYQDDK
jgi:hypothetical protein